MSDLVLTAASVIAGSNGVKDQGIAGATITAGQVVYKDSLGKYQLADNNSATALARSPLGVALHGASTNQPLMIVKQGAVTIGATLTPGVAYYLSDTPGAIGLYDDLASGEYVVFLGLATSATVLDLNIKVAGVAL